MSGGTPKRERKRTRVSDFAVKTPKSSRKRRKHISPASGSKQQVKKSVHDGEKEIDKLLAEVRNAISNDIDDANALGSDFEELKDAIREAEEAEENAHDSDGFGSSSDEDETVEDIPPKAKKASKKDLASGKASSKSQTAHMNGKSLKESLPTGSRRKVPDDKPANSNETSHTEENDSDYDLPSRHKTELEALKETDPSFYKYLQENDAELLDFDIGNSDSEGSGSGSEIEKDEPLSEKVQRSRNQRLVESESSDSGSEDGTVSDTDQRKAKDNTDDRNGSSDSGGLDAEETDGEDDSDEDEEAIAAAEAGLDVAPEFQDADEDSCNEEEEIGAKVKRKPKKATPKVVDLAYLRELQAQLSKRRSSLKAARDLLRIFRAGRELASGTQIKKKTRKAIEKSNKKGRRSRKGDSEIKDIDVLADAEDNEDSEDEFVDDSNITAGEIRFASAKAYQKAMNMAIIGIQETLDSLLGKPRSEKGRGLSSWSPLEHPRWAHVEPTFKTFAFHLLALTDSMQDARTLRFLLKRLEFLVPYSKGQPSLTRKLVRMAIEHWASQSRIVSDATKLRAYLLLHAVASEDSNTEIVLRKVCHAYVKRIAAVCNPRTLPNIMFAVNSVTELFGINMGASYTIAFTYIRHIAVTLRAVLSAKDTKKESEKIYNWSVLNSIRLWSAILARYGSEEELRPLIYPFVQVSLGILRLQSSPRNYPLRLKVCSFITDLALETGIFVPIAPHILVIFRCSEFKRNPSRGGTRPIEWRSTLRVSEEVVSTKPYLGGILQLAILELAKYFAGISKHVSFPEIAHPVVAQIRKFAKELRVPDWRRDLLDLCEQLRETSQLVTDARSKADFGPKGAIGTDGMREIVPGIAREVKTPIQRLFEIEKKQVEKEEALRDDAAAKNKEKGEVEDHEGSAEESEAEVVEPANKVEEGEGKTMLKALQQKQSHQMLESKRKAPSLMLIASDDEPDEVADFKLSDSEDE